jgi:hypothetical protein
MRLFPLIVVGVHTLLVILMAITGSLLGREAPMLWGVFMILDFPASLLGGPIESILGPLVRPMGHTALCGWLYGLMFAVLGGIQYFVVSLLIAQLIRRRRER